MGSERAHVPSSVARKVRQHCGFGCVLCGDMLTEYAHIEPQAEGGQDTLENLVLLCRSHHKKFDSGQISKKKVVASKNKAGSDETRVKANFLFEAETSEFIDFGSNKLEIADGFLFSLICINERNIIGVEFCDGIPFFSAQLSNVDGLSSFSIKENRIELIDDSYWDASITQNRFTVHYAKRTKLIDIEFLNGSLKLNLIRNVEDGIPFKLTNSQVWMGTGKGGSSVSTRHCSGHFKGEKYTGFLGYECPSQTMCLNLTPAPVPYSQYEALIRIFQKTEFVEHFNPANE